LVGALGCGLGAMVAKLTYGKRQWEQFDGQMRKLLPPLNSTMLEIIDMIDADTNAFNDFFAAMKLPKTTAEESSHREHEMQKAIVTAINVPMSLAKKLNTLWKLFDEVAEIGNINCKSDLQVAARCVEVGVQGAVHNVTINLKDLKNLELRSELQSEAEKQVEVAVTGRDKVLAQLQARS